ncbi:MAG: T9SS type A sorting domain-containing protein [Bacteroidetes bacterium]|jgi:hypothetical protein|nr:T9SS type A sorting domain-containing protein [Bacteroidota bacterium]MBK6821012.1 T9SS type A sorting domain-containing protein [Bacteroidota bacterium]MBK7039196.1 T9SS type A sorting domain-containing protein [Bacteroidota bacterium]MBK7587323.1 T9SS type A sorting domain-containing protein [Bacteroidota bacterium]MBK8329164.1 T9SS type A sorting domain-containing protein [Bacteroidota bacterium]
MINKIALFVTSLMFTTFISKAQIPNAGFENWDNMGAYANPTGWGTMNNTTALANVYTAEKATPGNPGASYLKLTSKTTPLGVANGIAVSGKLDSLTMQPISGFAYAARPASLDGAWQHMIFGNSQGGISVTLTKWNAGTNMRDIIGIGSVTLTGMAMSWANFSIPITYSLPGMPDSCIIFMKASGATPNDQDYLWVDNLTFKINPTGINDIDASAINIYPNPVNERLNIKSSIDVNEICITDATGRMVLCMKEEKLITVDVSKLSTGNYNYKLFSKNKEVLNAKFVKE